MSGLKTAVSYSLPSYQLGFCGPQEAKSKKVLLDFVAGKKVEEGLVKEALTKFEAPYPYFKLIAKSNGIPNPFDERVVRAMWVGNELLDKVKTGDLRKLIRTEFAKPGLLSPKEADARAKKVLHGAVPHHSFHVLILGPVTGRIKLEGTLLDLCRIGWGRVTKIKDRSLRNPDQVRGYSRDLRPLHGLKNSKLKVIYKPLVLGEKMGLGEEVEKEISWNKNIVPKVKADDWVSFHWGQACEVLNPTEVKSLEHYTKQTILNVNKKT